MYFDYGGEIEVIVKIFINFFYKKEIENKLKDVVILISYVFE